MDAPAHTESSTDEAQIRRLIEQQATAMRDRDAESLVARYAPGAVTFDLAPPLRHTGPEVRDAAAVRTWLATFDGPIHYEIRDLDVTVGDTVAFCHSLRYLGATPSGSQEGFGMWFRATACLRKIDGTWLITHEHESTPFHMDGSFQAAIDLQP